MFVRNSNSASNPGNPAGLFRLLMTGVAACLLAGCAAQQIELGGTFPRPLVSKLPLTVGVYYPEELRNYSYTEIDDYSGKDQYIISSGQSQVTLFNTVLPEMFQNVVTLDSPTTDDESIDAVFIPQLEEFQLGLPEKTKLDVFEIWLKYNMRLTDPSGDYIADWVMTAYGKSPTETFQSVDAGVQDAANVAMRDLAASLSLGFTEIPDVNDWLRSNDYLNSR